MNFVRPGSELPARGEVVFDFDSASAADALEAALIPEMGADVPGSRASMQREGARITLRIEAEDAGALRAAVNAYLRWARTCQEIHRLARD